MGKDKSSDDEDAKPPVAKNAIELQRFKLSKLMKNPDKPVVIPERLKEKKMPHVPEFVRNVMGSSAGAGSGEFHVYRHLRRKEYARQKFIQEKSEKQLLEEAYHKKLEENKQAAEEKTAKKRAKRLKNKAKKRLKKQNSKIKPSENSTMAEEENTSENDSESETDKEQSNAEKELKTIDAEKLPEVSNCSDSSVDKDGYVASSEQISLLTEENGHNKNSIVSSETQQTNVCKR